MSRSSVLALFLAAGLPATAPASPPAASADFTAALVGPPWISIELPVNPWDQETRGAFLVVHAYHHQIPMGAAVTGTAEGVVDGQRRSVTLQFDKTGRGGVFALRKQWEDRGRWVLVITVHQGQHNEDDVAQALVQIAEDGSVTSVRVPTRGGRESNIPRRATPAEIDTALRG